MSKLMGSIKREGVTIVPLAIYFNPAGHGQGFSSRWQGQAYGRQATGDKNATAARQGQADAKQVRRRAASSLSCAICLALRRRPPLSGPDAGADQGAGLSRLRRVSVFAGFATVKDSIIAASTSISAGLSPRRSSGRRTRSQFTEIANRRQFRKAGAVDMPSAG